MERCGQRQPTSPVRHFLAPSGGLYRRQAVRTVFGGFGLNLAESFMVGDKLIDLECGWNAGVKKSFLVRTGYGAEVEREDAEKISRAAVVAGLAEMAEWILAAR